MRTWKIACSAALLALGLATAAHADEWNKLTYLTFSGPVSMPGITLPAGTYRFELIDPDTTRRVIRVSDRDGSKNYGIFLSVSDSKLEPSDDPVVMFRETPSGIPQAIRAWFYPGETSGYEFVYPHDQAEKIAKATHQAVLAMNEPSSSTTEEDRVTSMRGAKYGRIDENGRPASSDEQLKNSSSQQPATTTAQSNSAASSSTTTASGSTSTTTASNSATPRSNTAQSSNTASNTASSNTASANAARSTTAPPTTAPRSTTASRSKTASAAATDQNTANSGAVGTSGRAAGRSLPRTASSMPFIALLSLLSIGSAAGVRVARKAIA